MKFDDSALVAHLVEKQLLLWNCRRLASRDKLNDEPFFRFLTIASDKGSLGDEIAQELSLRTGWHIFDKEMVSYIARNSHVSEKLVNQLDHTSQNLVQDMIERLLKTAENPSFGTDEYHEALLRTLGCLATHGCAILVGRGANFVLREHLHGLNIRITGSREIRINRLCKSLNVTMDQARHLMLANDEEQRKFINHYYKHDFDDDGFYDIVFNTDHASVEQVVSSVLSYMDHPERGEVSVQ